MTLGSRCLVMIGGGGLGWEAFYTLYNETCLQDIVDKFVGLVTDRSHQYRCCC
jgi:hypothetical protein